jgi:hypothetical protein
LRKPFWEEVPPKGFRPDREPAGLPHVTGIGFQEVQKVRKRVLWIFALLAVVAAGPAFAQGGAGSTGSIQGEVVDESGAVLPGVTVTATGTTMLGSQTAVTNAQGVYRFLGLPATSCPASARWSATTSASASASRPP